jgi:ATP-dependent RNA helicase DDX18/HAS1
LFLLPSELGFLRYLKQARVPLNEYEFPMKKISNVQSQLEKLVEKNFYLNKSARDGYRSYLQSYASHSLKNIFNANVLDLQKVASAFGFCVPPNVNINISASGKTKKMDRGNLPSANNMSRGKEHYLKSRGEGEGFKKANDSRQFSR